MPFTSATYTEDLTHPQSSSSSPCSVASCACKAASRSCDSCKARWLRRSSRCSFSQPAHALAPPAGWGATGSACNGDINLWAAVTERRLACP